MAKNWKVNEAIVAINNGEIDAINDIGRRFPLFVYNVANNLNPGIIEILKAVPEYVSVRKIETALKANVEPIEDDYQVAGFDYGVEEKAEKAEKKPAAKKGKGKPAKEEEPEEEDEDWDEEEVDEEETGEVDYESMTGTELRAEMKKQGLKVTKGMKKADFVEALQNAGTDEEDEEEEEEEVKPAKKKPAKKKPANKKSKKKPEPEEDEEDWDEEDEDDDWDI